MLRILLSLVVFSVSVAGAAAELRLRLQEDIAAVAVATGSFEEERFSPLKDHPFRLRGTFVLDRETGLSLAYADGRVLMRVTPVGIRVFERHEEAFRERPVPEPLEGLGRSLFALVRFDLARLEETFRLEVQGSVDHWRLSAQPREELEAGIVRSMEAQGEADRLQRLVIDRAAGRRIEITLTSVKSLPSLSDDLRATYFPDA